MDQTYLVIDTRGIQEYVFRAPKLKTIIGASALIKEFEKQVDDAARIHSCKVLYNAAGNATLTCPDHSKADEIVHLINGFCVDRGINCVSAAGKTESDTRLELSKKKRGVPSGAARTMSPFDLPCGECLVAPAEIARKKNGSPVCHVCDRKIKAAESFRWKKEIFETDEQNEFILDLKDDLDQGQNRIAVVYMDGNRLGEMMPHPADEKPDPAFDDKKQKFAHRVSWITETSVSEAYRQHFKGSRNRKGKVFFRPLVIGGDDIIAIMDPTRALDFCLTVCDKFNKLSRDHTNELFDKTMTISAGIAVVHGGYPLWRAMKLAGELLKNAKKSSMDGKSERIDFDVVMDSALQNIDERKALRKTEVDGETFILSRRPMDPATIIELKDKVSKLSKYNIGRNQIRGLTEYMMSGRIQSTYYISRLLMHHDNNKNELAQLLIPNDILWEKRTDGYFSDLPDLQLLYELQSPEDLRRADALEVNS